MTPLREMPPREFYVEERHYTTGKVEVIISRVIDDEVVAAIEVQSSHPLLAASRYDVDLRARRDQRKGEAETYFVETTYAHVPAVR